MKKLILFTSILIAFTSCANNDDDSQELTKYSIQDDRLLLTFEEADRNEFRIYKITKDELVLESDEDGVDIIYRDHYKK